MSIISVLKASDKASGSARKHSNDYISKERKMMKTVSSKLREVGLRMKSTILYSILFYGPTERSEGGRNESEAFNSEKRNVYMTDTSSSDPTIDRSPGIASVEEARAAVFYSLTANYASMGRR